MAVSVEILMETEAERGWEYVVRVEREGGVTEHRVRLAWVDHEHLAGGTVPPSRLVEELVKLAVERGVEMPGSVDASTLRRKDPALAGLLPWR